MTIDKAFIRTLADANGATLDDDAAERLARAFQSVAATLTAAAGHSLFDTEPAGFARALEALGDDDA